MASQGPLSPGTVVNVSDGSSDTYAWNNPGNAAVSDNSYAICNAGPSFACDSEGLKATNFGFTIPAGATINGILVEIEKKKASGDSANDRYVKIVKANGSLGTADKADATFWPGTDTYFSYGGSSDLWSETWTANDINNSNFGVEIAGNSPFSSSVEYHIDHIRITVHYTAAASTNPSFLFNFV